MKYIAVVVFFAVVSGEAPQFQGYNYDKPVVPFGLPARQQLPPQASFGFPNSGVTQNTYGPPEPQNNYGPPEPQNNYGPPQPQNNYGPPEPQNNYGPPSTDLSPPRPYDLPEGREADDAPTTTELPTTTEAAEIEAEELRDTEEVQEDKEDEKVYYIYHPSGVLQKVVYSAKDDVKNMAYSAQFRYKNVEPIRDPVYTYDPETLVLRQIVA